VASQGRQGLDGTGKAISASQAGATCRIDLVLREGGAPPGEYTYDCSTNKK
jgi:hypothetical protein